MVTMAKNLEPEVCEYVDNEGHNLTIEIILPGVAKENIRLRVNINSLLLIATADNVSYVKYLSFPHPTIPEMGKAIYDHDLLRIKIPFQA